MLAVPIKLHLRQNLFFFPCFEHACKNISSNGNEKRHKLLTYIRVTFRLYKNGEKYRKF